ncbi:hypothetical protein K0504_05405 [Neiella marina]|uniref:Uncharacterized protein n=1 Tax=Neiella holothuriorum TaxID=2870530 RepID=A0ABS7EDR6_9GAMM|nr:hypothetical protein [Neiella holothuriorum]MBW8190467.1 hypothetical protein [Neiella holothuriorum]
MITACGGGSSSSGTTSEGPTTELESIYPYQTSSYSDVLVECVNAYQDEKSCYADVLPPIGAGSSSADVDAIMDRVVVSHDWMAARIETFLQQASPSLIAMFDPLSAIVIAYDIRPAFYHPLTGAMYIDPAYLWLSPTEYATIDDSPDYRSGYGSELVLDTGWRYVDDAGNYITTSNFSDGDDTRSFADIVPGLTNLLYHELAHANDYLPPDVLSQLMQPFGDDSFYDLIDQVFDDGLSIQQRVVGDYPLIYTTLKNLADVLFGGDDASSVLLALTAPDAGAMFELDGASDMYNYYTSSEDIAMLFEEALMSYTLDALRDVAFLHQDNDSYCEKTIGWGQRGRIANNLVKARAQQVISLMLPDQATAINNHLDSLDAPQALPNDVAWCTSRTLLSAQSLSLLAKPTSEAKQDDELRLPVGH